MCLPRRRLPARLSRSAGGPQAAQKFSAESLEYIAGLDIERDAAVLKEQVSRRPRDHHRIAGMPRLPLFGALVPSSHLLGACIYISIYVCVCARARARGCLCVGV